MSAATTSIPTSRRAGVFKTFSAAATLLLQGVLWARNASGYVTNAEDATGLKVVGIGAEEVDNSAGSAGDLEAKAETGIFLLANSATGTLTDAHIGRKCYVEDNQTVSIDPGTYGVVAGIVRKVDSSGVWVEVPAGEVQAGEVVACGIHTWAGGAATTDSISVTGLLATDVVICTLAARASTETLVMAANDAGNDQIDLTLSANGTNGTTKVHYAVLRPGR